jgi:hypothetical protein
MFSGKLVDTIVKHSDDIMRLVIKRVREDGELKYVGSLSDSELLERGRHILGRLETWLNPSKRASLRRDYEELGKRRFEQSVPLHEAVRVLLLIRSQAIEYVMEQGFDQSSLEIHAERELEHWLASFFDVLVYHLVKGYESALRELPAVPSTPHHEPYPFWVP